MVLSQRTQYAVRAVFELAKREGAGPVKASTVAASQHIPARFLENILGQLRQAGVVEATRGKEGGYRIARPPADVSVGEVIRLMQGPISVIECAGGVSGRDCALRMGCVLLPMWEKAHNAMMSVYDETFFGDLVEQERAITGCEVLDYAI
ncbi:MAG: Rrf2 family transcriptional regulator [Actinobacteria bacterium]|nr:Rrf2 family transcriptional regulator [Actinomycetota bacterium]